jgi:hypothetical protein
MKSYLVFGLIFGLAGKAWATKDIHDSTLRVKARLCGCLLCSFQVTNGWQVNRDKNKEKALGLAYTYDRPIGVKTSYRYYNNLFAKIFVDLITAIRFRPQPFGLKVAT